MKIALVNDKYIHHEGGGAQESVRILAESLASRGHEVSVWTTTYRPDQKRTTEIHAGVRVTFLPVANVYWPHGRRPALLKPLWHAIDAHNPIMAHRIGQLLDEEKPDILHTNILAGFSPAIWAEASRRNIPVVHTVRDYYLVCPKGARFRNGTACGSPCAACRLYNIAKKRATRHLDAVVSISHHLSKNHFVQAPIREVIYNSYRAEGKLRPREEGGGLQVGYLGRLFETKGIELLIDAVRRTDSAHLYIAGKGKPTYVETLRDRAPAQTTFLGTLPPEALFGKIDVLVVPSLWHEPFGRVVIEAMAWGIPVIASRRGGLREIIRHSVDGWFFEPDEKDSLARLLRLLTPQICRSKRLSCLKRARAFLPEAIADQYEHVYGRVLLYRQDPAVMKQSGVCMPEATPGLQSFHTSNT